MSRPLETGVDVALSENRGIMSRLIPQASSAALWIGVLHGDPWLCSGEVLWSLSRGDTKTGDLGREDLGDEYQVDWEGRKGKPSDQRKLLE